MTKLTVRAIETLIAAQRANGEKPKKLIADTGLHLRIATDGAGTWLVRYMFGGKEREFRLPTPYGDGEGYCSLAAARAKATEIRSKARDGIDYALERAEALAAIERRRQAEVIEHARLLNRHTVNALFKRWDELVLSKRKGAEEVRRGWNKDVLPAIGPLFAEEVTRADIMAVLDPVVARGANRLANRQLSEMRQLFGFALVRDVIKADPTHRIAKKDVGGKEVERDRTLSEAEIIDLHGRVPVAGLKQATQHVIWLLLATGCRIGELTSAQREHIDIDAGTWTLPITKNKKPHTVYLSEFAKEHMAALLGISKHKKLLMPGRDEHPVCPKSTTKQLEDRQLGHYNRKPLSNRTVHAHSLELAGGKWTPHDLRRTAATLMGTLGVRPDIIERCLNHTEQNRIVRTYQRQELKQEQADAWETLGNRLQLLTRDEPGNVTVLRPKAA